MINKSKCFNPYNLNFQFKRGWWVGWGDVQGRSLKFGIISIPPTSTTNLRTIRPKGRPCIDRA